MVDEKFTGHSSNEVISIICNDCIYNIKGAGCKAFPKRIPDIILNGINNYSTPLPNQDNDYVFETVEVE